MATINVDDEWASFMTTGTHDYSSDEDEISVVGLDAGAFSNLEAPEPTNLYISTRSKIAYLSKPVNLEIFWDIKVIPYAMPQNGVIKKQIKIDSDSSDKLAIIQDKLKNELYVEQQVKLHIDNPTGKIKFKDVRKVSIGISKKDIESYRSKKTHAFLNCFVLRIRLKFDKLFKEFHVKVFNAGKLEVPGIQNDAMLLAVFDYVVYILQPFYNEPITYTNSNNNVLINSNFNCRFYINRETLFDIIRNNYNIESIYDPCSYPGIQCTFYYNNESNVQTGLNVIGTNQTKMSFMIFRTGSVLIVGSCAENVLYDIYKFVVTMLKTEFKHICQSIMTQDEITRKSSKKVPRKKKMVILVGVPEEEKMDEQEYVQEQQEEKNEEEQEREICEEIIVSELKKGRKKKTKNEVVSLKDIAKVEVEKEVNKIKETKTRKTNPKSSKKQTAPLLVKYCI